jgi:hypothetical protein
MSTAACSPLALALSAAYWACLISDTMSACRAGSVGLASAVVTLVFLLDFLWSHQAQLVEPLPA